MSLIRNIVVLATLAVVVQGCGAPEDSEDIIESSGELSFVNVSGTNSPFFNDAGTVCDSAGVMPNYHCCPDGTVMVGAHLGANVFRCAKMNGSVSNIAYSYETRNNMLSCPWGKVMTGYWAGTSRYLETIWCGTPPYPVRNFEYVDDGKQAISQDAGMHVCRKDTVNPGRFAMSGIHRGANKFNCFQ